MGHCSVRTNGGGTPLRATDKTFVQVLKNSGYETGGFGKWGAGGRDSTGVPEKHGFDIFFGYYDQVHAHSFFPPYLIRNSEEVKLPGNEGGRTGESYSHYEIMNQGLQFIRDNKDKRFFAYFPITPPHGMFDIPADDPAWDRYKDEAWIKDESIKQDIKNYAAMVSMIDNDLKRILDLLKELNLEDNTLVFFTGDNGGQDRFKSNEHKRGFFGPNVNPKTGVEFRGGKSSLYEGGLRIPYLVRWPEKIKAGRVSDLVFSQVDVFETLQELVKHEPLPTDGMSILPELLGEEVVGRKQEQHEFLYWEYGPQTAVRMKNWKAVRPRKKGKWQLFDLSKDISEANDIAAQHPDVLEKIKKYAVESHTPAQPGTFTRTDRHYADSRAKWGTTRLPMTGELRRAMKKIKEKGLIPASEMSLVRSSSENRSNDRMARYVIDGKSNTFWHSKFGKDLANPPHELVIDLGKEREITGFRYLARQDGGWNGAFAKTEFSVSNSADEFPTPIATRTFEKVKDVQAADLKEPTRARYVRLKILSEVNGKPWASAAEIGVIAK